MVKTVECLSYECFMNYENVYFFGNYVGVGSIRVAIQWVLLWVMNKIGVKKIKGLWVGWQTLELLMVYFIRSLSNIPVRIF